ncbi:NB-ARC domain-containing protein [Lentzea fradiae]|uniref:NB-ARC domain-containing protein n=1 Tax=Lentzea fradiae TaxID=200378 RepID=A0A1G8CM86_9PSEU|nr:NB-ARC domain-containing protein [Lentzea fradiae]SDH46403.1 NB-ARC domain-containing protein [Lentzea fradiae]
MGQVRKPVVPRGAVRTFFDRLHALHSAAGHPSMRELQRSTRSRQRPNGINPTTIHQALSGPRMARWDTVHALVSQLGGNVEEFAALWQDGRRAEFEPEQPVGDAGHCVGRPTPKALPPDVPFFVGRTRQQAELCGLLAPLGQAARTAAISGTAGVGKTALAVHWAHRVADRFPDGNLYIDLRGYDPASVMPAAEALASLLRGLGVRAANVPTEVSECAAWYRSLLADRKMLIVLDNARDTDHVRPLLPGTPSCLVVVTSRDSLAGLVARHGARRVRLDVLELAEATELMRELLLPGFDRERAAIEALAERCARLPLALRIAAELANSSTVDNLADLVREFTDDERRLDLLNAGDDPRTAIRSVFSWSYRRLPEDAAGLFRSLGECQDRLLDLARVAALARTTADQAGRLTEVLVRKSVLERVGPGEFTMNSLLWAYAADCQRRF